MVVAVRYHNDEPGLTIGLGVDVEDDWASAERNLHRFGTPGELSALAAACGTVRPLHLWCVKEAVAKATGLGFHVPVRRYRVHPGDGTPQQLSVEIDEFNPAPNSSYRARVRVGTRPTRPPTAWAVAELPLCPLADERSNRR
ncbi:4'-phosphopantetheinyl transferase family protein [Streptomyces fagopyri]|uniref:4'-phosphopantetheinyl transferase family protein n=1 Tax=Streptomyces fagopyri TaxID=2662397 RepID=UPI003827560D